MSNEIPDSDSNSNAEIKAEFDLLIKDQEAKEFSREKVQKAIWGLEILVQDNEITPETDFDGILRAVRNRLKELRQTVISARHIMESRSEDEEGKDFHKVAGEEKERAERLLNYMEEAEFSLRKIQTLNLNFHFNLNDIRRKLENRLKEMDRALDRDEQKKRKGE